MSPGKILKGWNVPGAPAKAIMSVGVGWGKIMNPPGGEIILRKVPPARWAGGGSNVGNYFTLKKVSSYNYV